VLTGDWKKISDSKNSYGISWLQSDAGGTGNRTARFIPEIRKAGKYQVYTYVPKIAGASSAIVLNISDGRNSKEIILDHKNVVVQGQTSGEWVSLGMYQFPESKKGFVEVTNKKADGIVIADAVLLVPEGR